ncbi:MAG: DUF547 domain-containing protein [Gemmatimonadetes bacterium]|nr:DUF547 domain-containing protein [Gemmatimonadota bacterium]
MRFRLMLCLALSPFVGVSSAAVVPAPDHAPFDALLHEYVTPYGVRYADWHANADDMEALNRYIHELEHTPIEKLAATPGRSEAALAYWINLYNAATLRLVLEGYPVDSIKDLGNLLRTPWKKDVVTVEGHKLSLDRIENSIIRVQFREPRIHFALNCAAIGCPPLRGEAYRGGDLESQLEAQTRQFLGDPRRNWVDGEGRAHLSKILDWYHEDFERDAGSVIEFVRPYMEGMEEIKPGTDIPIEYTDYDWSLNEDQRPPNP